MESVKERTGFFFKIALGLAVFLFVFFKLAISPSLAVTHNRVLFTHHSVGRIVYANNLSDPYDGTVDSNCTDGSCSDLPSWFNTYNNSQTPRENFVISEKEWPGGIGNNPLEYWNILVGSGCNSGAPKPGDAGNIGNICSISDFNYDVIVIKHCYTASGKSDHNQDRTYYNALKTEFDKFNGSMPGIPSKIFIVWTLFPSVSGTPADRDFANWVKNTWLNDGSPHPNIFIWDVFNYATCDGSNSLYTSYQWGGNHPNRAFGHLLANGGRTSVCTSNKDIVGLGQFIVNSVKTFEGAAGSTPTPTRTPTPGPITTLTPTPTRTTTPTTTVTPRPTTPTPSSPAGLGFFPFGFMYADPPDFPKVANTGANAVHRYPGNMTSTAIRSYLDTASANKLQGIIEINRDMANNLPALAALVNAVKNHPALYAWYIPDEAPLSIAKPLTATIKTNDPLHPVYGNPGTTDGSVVSSYATNVGVNVLWVAAYPNKDYNGIRAVVTRGIRMAKRACYQNKIKYCDIGHISGTFDPADYDTTFHVPTAEELRNDIYQGIIGGSQGVWMFEYNQGDVAEWLSPMITKIRKELFEPEFPLTFPLTNVILEPEIAPTISPISLTVISGPAKSPPVGYFHTDGETGLVRYDSIQYLQKKYLDNLILFTVNIAQDHSNGDTVGARFDNVPAGINTVQVLFENRTLTVANNSFTDTFDPLAVHVYRLANPSASLSLTPTPPTCSRASFGDFNCDLKINESDLNALLSKWMTNLNDITGDGITNESDLNKLLGNWRTN